MTRFPAAGTLAEHLYGFSDKEDMGGDMAAFAALLRESDVARAAARRCLALVPWCVSGLGGPSDLEPLPDFLERHYLRAADDWVLAKVSEARVGESVLCFGFEYVVEADPTYSRRRLRGAHGLRLANVTEETVVARRKQPLGRFMVVNEPGTGPGTLVGHNTDGLEVYAIGDWPHSAGGEHDD